jgi:hypothetical protein
MMAITPRRAMAHQFRAKTALLSLACASAGGK